MIVALTLLPATAKADGIDVWWLLSRAPGWEDAPVAAASFAMLLMLLNYLLNLLVLGRPARADIKAAKRSTLLEIALLTSIDAVLARRLSIRAALLTNPAWLMFAFFIDDYMF